MGTPEFAKIALKSIVDNDHNVLAVFSQPPKPVGRGKNIQKSAVHEYSESHGICVYTPKTMRSEDVVNTIKTLDPDLIIVAAYGFIIPQAILDLPKFGCINIHGSVLPRWRGAAPIHHAIMSGDEETGITIMKMDAGMDTGDIIKIDKCKILEKETLGELRIKLAEIGANSIINVLDDLDKYLANSYKQTADVVTIATKITKDMEQINWNFDAKTIERSIRALSPDSYMWTAIDNMRIKIIGSTVVQGDYSEFSPGKILDGNFVVSCGDRTFLRIELLQPAGKKIMKAADFINGHKEIIGCTFNEKVSE